MFETKEQVLEKIMAQDKPVCCDCGKEMSLWEVPPINFSDGLGWGSPYLYVCFNDECSAYQQGWDHLKENYSHTASYRRMCYPGTDQYELMPQEEMLKEAMKKGFSILAQCYVDKDAETALRMVLDPTEPPRVRLKAAEMLGDIGELEAIDPLRNLNVGNRLIEEQLENAISKIHERFYTRECPFCAEIIKKKAKICKHCSKDVAGR